MKFLASSFLMFSTTIVVAEHKCIHDEIEKGPRIESVQNYDNNHPYEHAGKSNYRRLASSASFSPIRFTPVPNDFSGASTSIKDFINNKLVPDAVTRLSQNLNVIPVQGNLFASQFCGATWPDGTCATAPPASTQCGSDMNIPSNAFGTYTYYDPQPGASNMVSVQGGSGYANADMVLYINSIQSSSCPSGVATSGTLAYALACQFDQFGRPTFGAINFCPTMMSTDPAKYDELLKTAVHEMTHSLGFSASLFATYRDINTGAIRTKVTDRDSTLRGKPSFNSVTPSGDIPGGPSTQLVITPSVAAYVQGHFNCPSLTGAEIEDQGGDGTAGSHWELRTYGNEYMTGVTVGSDSISGLSFALLADSGWYTVNANFEPYLFGNGKGCSFVTNKCITNGKSIDPATWCTDTTGQVNVCDTIRSGYGKCNAASYSAALPSFFQYFSSNSQGGGLDVADFCPFIQPYGNRICSNPANNMAQDANAFGELYGAKSICLDSTLLVTGFGGGQQTGACYGYDCACSNGATSIAVTACPDGTTSSGCVTQTCTSAGQQLTFPFAAGTITCPALTDVCRTAADYSGGIQSCAPYTIQSFPGALVPLGSNNKNAGKSNIGAIVGSLFVVVLVAGVIAVVVVRRRRGASPGNTFFSQQTTSNPVKKSDWSSINAGGQPQYNVPIKGSVGNALPPGWTLEYDEATKRSYYFNAATNASSWTKPTL